MMKTVGVVLAGGMSRRFGSPKAFAKLNNKSFYTFAMEALETVCDEVIVVTRPELVASFPPTVNVRIDVANYAGLGPLAGILSAMESVEADRYMVLPCDMPYVDGAVISKLMKYHKTNVTAVISRGRHHPLVSIWDRTMKTVLQQALKSKQLRVMNILSASGVTWANGCLLTEDEARVFTNINTPDVLERG
ncbi:molybdenum cofactor guanylyltransferase [Sporosarcina limicola]|uniref:Probable molybdenum cofactor guanylyltransferase n=1 Tax=Sporosarcina limicola TaxID=34101 RepID=A0A927R7B7_9BACL|nr:molybdenum cofactor guanylyltransferase [Sporosarcina limicola]MBE1555824.1 molybdopterin-guanine dinucleotide biosynthesis protein A [Sporosarcina limicola]